jgi:peptidoglycan/LPS O-acetylase OafA/YrhL
MHERYGHLDGLRGIAALIVVLHHAAIAFDFAFYTGVPSTGHGDWAARISGLPFLLPLAGNYSVCVFFALSGFVLASSFSRTALGAPALIVKRTIRLGIPILSVCLVSWLLLSSGLTFNIQAQAATGSAWLVWGQLPRHPSLSAAMRDGLYGSLLGLPQATEYDSSLWTMSIEYMGSLLMIAVFAAIRPLRADHGRDMLLVAIFLALGLLGHSLYLCLFAFGAAIRLGDLRRILATIPGLNWIMAVVLISGLFLGTVPYSAARGAWLDALTAYAPVTPQTSWQAPDGAWRGIPGETFWHAVGAILTLIAADSWPMMRRLLDARLPRFLGRISFPLYLLHVPILLSAGCGLFLLLIQAGFDVPRAWVVAAAAFIAISLTAAFVWTLLVEERAIAWSNGAARRVYRLVRAILPKQIVR